MKTRNLSAIFFPLLFLFFLSCKKNDADDVFPDAPQEPLENIVDSIKARRTSFVTDPNGNKDVWIIEIFGKGFPYYDLIVKVNGKQCQNVWSNDTYIRAELPARAGSGSVELQFSGQTFKSKEDFLYPWHAELTMLAFQGQKVTVSPGTSFALDQDHNVYLSSYGSVRKLTPQNQLSSLYYLPAYNTGANEIGVDKNGMVYRPNYMEKRVEKYDFKTDKVTVLYENLMDEDFTPSLVTVNNQGEVILTNEKDNSIKKISAEGTLTHITGPLVQENNFAETGIPARYLFPKDLTVDKNGDFLIADTRHIRVFKVTPSGKITTLAGNGTMGDEEGRAENAAIGVPLSIVADEKSGLIYVLDNYYSVDGLVHRTYLRVITPDGYCQKIKFQTDDSDIYRFGYEMQQDHLKNARPVDLAIDADGVLYGIFYDSWGREYFIIRMEIN